MQEKLLPLKEKLVQHISVAIQQKSLAQPADKKNAVLTPKADDLSVTNQPKYDFYKLLPEMTVIVPLKTDATAPN